MRMSFPDIGRRRGFARRLREVRQKAGQVGTDALQFQAMGGSELFENARSLRGQSHVDLAPVVDRGPARDQAFVFEAVDKPDRAVVLDEELVRELVDRDRLPARAPLDRQQRLVLLRRKANFAGRGLAERQEASQRVTERRQYRVLRWVETAHWSGPRRFFPSSGRHSCFRLAVRDPAHRRLTMYRTPIQL